MQNETIIRIADNENITIEKNGVVKMPKKPAKPSQIAQAFINSFAITEVSTPVLPKGSIYYSKIDEREYVVLEREKTQRPVNYFGSWIKSVGFPKLIMGICVREGYIIRTKLAAVKDAIITPQTEIFFYPYSNVYPHNMDICWGNFCYKQIQELYQLSSLLDMFLGLEMNNDLYRGTKEYRQLLEEMSEKEFDENQLRPMNRNFEQFLKTLKEEN